MAVIVAAVFGATEARAQTNPPDTTVGEIVVTARKREESLQSVPVAVSALSGENLAQQNIRQPSDLQRSVPSLIMAGSGAQTGTGTTISIRGQAASDVLLTLSQPVGLYEDSVNIPHPVGANVAFFDIARVEVLKGPQGTLYGRNTTGGAINVITRGADYRNVHGFGYAEAGDHDDWKIAGAVNVPIIQDMLAARLAYQHWNRQGFGRSAVTGQRLGGDRDDDVARLSLKFDPTSTLSGILKAEYVQARRTDSLFQTRALVARPAFSTFGIPAPFYAVDAEWALEGRPGGVLPSQLLANSQGLFTNYADRESFERLKAWHYAFDVSWDITEGVRLRSVTGYHYFDDRRVFDLDALPLIGSQVGFGVGGAQPNLPGTGPVTRPLGPDQQSRQFSQELNLSGRFADRLNWLVGAFVSHDHGRGAQFASSLPELAALPPPLGNGFPRASIFDSQSVDNDSWALFTQNDVKLTDQFSITLGARYTEERLQQDIAAVLYNLSSAAVANRYICLAGPPGLQAQENNCLVHESGKFSGTSYLLSFNFQLTPDALLYAKTARGFRGGALQVRAPNFPPAAPEIATDYEIGLKSDFFGRRLRTNLAAYQTNYKNKQETAIVVINGANTTPIQNAASAQIRGFEAEVTAVPVEHIKLRGSLGYIDTRYLNYPRAVTSFGIVNGTDAAFSGSPAATPPRWTTDIGVRYELPLASGTLALDADYAWRSKLPTTVINNDPGIPRALQDEWRRSIGLLNMNLSYALPDMGLTFSLFGANVLDKKYQTQALSFNTFGYTGVTQEPRMWGVSVRKTFGDE